jgi:colanic acid/amylovoran biosynthesis glycosyltransferase
VVHFAERFLAVTENWIYHQVVRASRYQPVVATEARENADQFPFEPIVLPHEGLAYQLFCSPDGSGLARRDGARAIRRGGRRNRVAVPLQLLSRAFEPVVRPCRPRVMHAHFGTEAVHLLRLRRRLGVPLVTTFYGYDASSVPRLPGWRQWYRQLFAVGDRFLVEGGAFRQRLLELGCPPEKATVQHLGVDLDELPFRPRRTVPGEPVRLLMAASFREKKGHEYAVRAFAEARRQMRAESPAHSSIELRLIGDGELKLRIEALVRDLGIGDQVVFLGAQPHGLFREELFNCHLFLSPSVTAADGDTEGGAPVGIIEASATGMPVVATKHADIPEVIRHGETGWLAPERDAAELAAHLVRLLKRPESWPAIGERGRQHIEAQYNLSTQAQRLEAIYDELPAPGERRGRLQPSPV